MEDFKMKKVEYKEVYRILYENGAIEEIINKYSKEENIQLVKQWV